MLTQRTQKRDVVRMCLNVVVDTILFYDFRLFCVVRALILCANGVFKLLRCKLEGQLTFRPQMNTKLIVPRLCGESINVSMLNTRPKVCKLSNRYFILKPTFISFLDAAH